MQIINYCASNAGAPVWHFAWACVCEQTREQKGQQTFINGRENLLELVAKFSLFLEKQFQALRDGQRYGRMITCFKCFAPLWF